FKISFEVNHQTLEMVALFFLAPILAIIAWLLLLVAGTSDWKVFAVTSFASGFIAKSIISKMQQIAGDPLAEAPDKKPKKPKNLPENSP
ncbi:MAG: hypothetical protein OEQ12_06775, partial [Nitrosopumilus sp.]|nr:hypothetical protein [Nitrosopumilus sp.]